MGGDASFNSYRDLRVWQDAMKLVEQCYGLTKAFPRDELFGLTSQVRRAAVSIPANIAEGHGRESTGAFVQFLRTAQGSLKELATHFLISERVGVADGAGLRPVLVDCDAVGRQLRALIRSLQRRAAIGGPEL